MPGGVDLVVLPDGDAVAAEAADRIAAALAGAIAARSIADWATTGGSSPPGFYRHLIEAPLRDRVDWRRVRLWWGDDRFVARDDPRSNVRAADAILLGPDGVPIPPDAVHPWPCGEALARAEGPDAVARRYADQAVELVPIRDGVPAFDLVVIGIGPDGHLLSVFPGSRAFGSDAVALGIPAPSHVEPHVERVTFTPRILDAAGSLIVIATGAAKAEVLGHVFGPLREERRWPAQRAVRPGAVWLLDEAAASELDVGEDRARDPAGR
jgi:6-phosphogluconolactonase